MGCGVGRVIGTFINVGAIIAGGAIGATVGGRLPDRIRLSVMHGLGLVTALVGVQLAMETKNILIVLGAVLSGGILGELLHLHEGLDRFGRFLQTALARKQHSLFGQGFVTASLVFCIGPMAVIGSIQDGLAGDFRLLAIKSTLDGFASIAFAATLGWGVACSALSILLYQGSITLFATTLSRVLTDPMISEMTATGGLIIVGISLKLLELKDMRLASLLPALAIAPLLTALVPLIRQLLP